MIYSGGFDLRKEKEIDKVRKLLNNVSTTGATDVELASALNNLQNKVNKDILSAKKEAITSSNTHADDGLNTLHTTISNNIATAKSDAIASSNSHGDEKAEEILNAVVNILALR